MQAWFFFFFFSFFSVFFFLLLLFFIFFCCCFFFFFLCMVFFLLFCFLFRCFYFFIFFGFFCLLFFFFFFLFVCFLFFFFCLFVFCFVFFFLGFSQRRTSERKGTQMRFIQRVASQMMQNAHKSNQECAPVRAIEECGSWGQTNWHLDLLCVWRANFVGPCPPSIHTRLEKTWKQKCSHLTHRATYDAKT